MLVILPFEKEFYAKYGVKADFVGHPLLDAIASYKGQTAQAFRTRNQLDMRPIIALLPGSRKQEVSRMLGVMTKMIPQFSNYQFVIAAAPSLEDDFFQSLADGQTLQYVKNQTYDLIRHANAALVTSGTATLETALLGTPEVVCYKGNRISYEIAKRIIDVKYISVNLIMDKEVVKELIQDDLNTKNLKAELHNLLSDTDYRSKMELSFDLLREKLGGEGASANAAKIIFDDLT